MLHSHNRFLSSIILLLFCSLLNAQTEPCDCSDGTPTTEAQLTAGGSFCGNATIDVGATFNVTNEICWSGGTLTLVGNDADVNIMAIFQVTGGTIDLDGDSGQDVDILSGGNLIVEAGATFFAQDQIDVGTGGEMNVYGTVFSNSEEITVANGGTINVFEGGVLSSGTNDEITVVGTMNVWGTVNANATSFINGTLIVNSSGIFNVGNGGDLTADGGIITSMGELNIADDLEAYNGAYISILGPDAVVNVGDDVEVVSGSTLYVSQNGVITVNDNMYNATADNGGGQGTGTIIIDGTANVVNELVIHNTTPDSGLSGSGTINFTNGTITDNEGDNNFICSGSPAVCSGNNTPLPVELIEFTYEIHGKSIHLKWTTASELNNEGFFVEKSLDGEAFDEIGFVKGHGTTKEKQQYKFVYNDRTQGYFRLRQVDFDGTTDYSKLLFLPDSDLSTERLSVYPNPTTGSVTLPIGITSFSFYTQSGKLLREGTDVTSAVAQDQINEILEGAESGIYLLVSVMNDLPQVIKIVKK